MADSTLETTHLTRAGFLLLAKALAGKQLQYTKAVIGDSERNGNVVYPTRAQQYEYTALLNPKMTLPLIDVAFTGGGTATIKARLSNASVATGFWCRELGLYAKDPDTNAEVLYCYRNVGDLCDYVPPSESSSVYDVVLAVVTVVQEATNVTAIIDASLAYVTQPEFNAHVDATVPHPNAPSLKSNVTSTDNFWVTNNDSHLHKITTANARLLILGGDASTIPMLTRRLNQTEVNIANLYMQLMSERELGLQPNLLLVEDFTDADNIDSYDVEVITEAAGAQGVRIETDTDILAGHWYTLTDGVHDEYVRIKSVAKNSGAIVAFFDSEIANTYDLTKTRLMRTTALVKNGHAQGSGRFRKDSHGFAYTPWTGVASDVATTLTLATTVANADSFVLEGDYAFTSAGEFTLSI